LLDALFVVKAIPHKNTKDKQQLGWHRCCRTDSGVHAARNVITAKLYPELATDSGFLELVNNALPKDIRLLEIQKAKEEFNPKNFCKRRVYEYLLPTKILKRNIIGNNEEKMSEEFTQQDLDYLNRLLKKYEGTHPFHNFTVKVKNTDPSARRHMVNLQSSEPFKINDKEFVCVSIYGGSFMLHQIRRMMGLIVSVMRGHTDEYIIEKSLNEKFFVNIPEAPGHCLV
jgi:tRNA pseudouridine38-40 synthase